MSTAARTALLALLAALGLGCAWLLFGGGTIAPAGPSTENTPPPTGMPAATTGHSQAPPTAIPPAALRTEATPVDRPNRDAAQGVRGRVLRPDGTPVAGLSVFLMPNTRHHAIDSFLLSRRGVTVPPVAQGYTAGDGSFALGTTRPGTDHDVRVLSSEFAEHDTLAIPIGEGSWIDLGDLLLEPGSRVQGHVFDEATQRAVAGATVFLADEGTLLPTPGRERGICVTTTADGSFAVANAAPRGAVTVTVEAPGYVPFRLPGQQLRVDEPLDLRLPLARGRPVAGIVVDPSGAPIAGTRVSAHGLSLQSSAPALSTTRADGRFRFDCLRDGPYRIEAEADGFRQNRLPSVLAGAEDERIVLAPKPAMRLRVRSAAGTDLTAYRIALKRHLPDTPLGLGNVPEFADRDVTPADCKGPWATVRGVPIGTFVLQVQERAHAKTLSPPFTIADSVDADPVEVTVTLTAGAMITGVVVDAEDRPVAGAIVATSANADGGFQAAGGIVPFFADMIPEKHTAAQVRTGADGTFRLPRLAFADYMLRVRHDDYCDAEVHDLVLATAGQTVDVGRIRLVRGTIVEGRVCTDGHGISQARVQLRTPDNAPEAGGGAPAPMFTDSAVTDRDGRFRLPRRVPPGPYTIAAMRSSAGMDPFQVLLDQRDSERRVVIHPGQERLEFDLSLPGR